MTARTNVTIYLTNSNDEPPLIIITPDNIPTIPENSPPQTVFADLSSLTVDRDPPGLGSLFNFTLLYIYDDDYEETNDTNSSFSLSPSGLLTALRTFDREARPEGFILSILTTDFGYPTQSMITNVSVAIGDENDQTPFYEFNGTATAYEMIPAGQLVLENFTATDYDIGNNARLKYAIIDGNPNSEFMIDSASGTLFTAQVLNKTAQEYYNLTVYVTDSGIPPLYGYGSIFVTVIDSNDNAPVFYEPLHGSFKENSTFGTIIYTINATDYDEGTNSIISYYFAPNATMNFTYFDNTTNITVVRFSLDNVTGEISIMDHFDREIEEVFQFDVIAVDSGLIPMPLTSTATIKIYIEDVNDNIPFFANQSYEFEVIENTPLNTTIGYVYGFDNDATYPNNGFQFSLEGLRSDELAVDPNTGLLYVNDTIDWEEGPSYTINIIISDLGTPSLSSYVDLTIYIEDINDRAPEWNITSLNISVFENSLPGTLVGYIIANDPDSIGNNSLVSYDIAMDYAGSHFALDSETGEVTTLRTFNREGRDLYDMVVVATDHGSPPQSSSATVFIEILDTNDHSPYFIQDTFRANISESAAIGTPVLQVLANDNDIGSNGKLIFDILPYNDTKFTINSTSGVISINNTLDYELGTRYQFIVIVNDSGIPSYQSFCTVIIDVLDYNDHEPVFNRSSYSIEIVENIAIATTLIQVGATDVDQDENAFIEYILLEGPDSSYFGINNITGVMYTTSLINREELNSDNISLVIMANNSNSNVLQSSLTTVSVNVHDLNDQAPTFNATIVIQVIESTEIGSIVYTLVPRDGDQGINGTVTYSVISGNTDTFQLDSTTGNITLLKNVNYDDQTHYYLSVNATDNGINPLSNYTTLIFEVTNDNNHVPTLPLYFVTLDPFEPVSTAVLTVMATDIDGDIISYSISEGMHSTMFTIGSTSGTVSVAGSLSSYQNQLINITIEASDGKYNTTTNITFHINGISGVSFTSKSYSTSIYENHVSSTYVLELYSNAVPASPSNVFDIIAGNINSTFSITGTALYVDSSKVDYEVKQRYQLSIKLTDINGLFAYSIININILDINEHTPSFPQSSFFVFLSETTIARQPFFILSANDDDFSSPPNKIRYYIVSGNDNSKFSLDANTGQLSLNTMLDYNTDDHYYTLNVSGINDLSSPQLASFAIINIELLNGNRHTPLFNPFLYQATVTEDSQIEALIGINVTATDADTGSDGVITYGLLGDHRQYDFVIDQATGVISIGPGGLDYERIGLYSLRAIATDGGVPQLWSSAIIIVTIEDLNDNIPIWESEVYSVSVIENTTIGTEIIRVHATDLDPIIYDEAKKVYNNVHGLITYSITDGDTLSQFSIGPMNGSVIIQSPLNREAKDNYTLVLNATDGGGLYSNAILYVKVIDINDVIPHFASPLVTADIPEDAVNVTYITQVQATDEDLVQDENIIITYSIVDGKDNDTFFVNSTTGEVFLINDIDRETQMFYNLTIAAADNNVVPLTGYVTLLITVLDINEHPPMYDQSLYTVSIYEYHPVDTSVINITATDIDYDENGTVVYSIISADGNGDDAFAIDSNTGVIYVVESVIDYEIQTQYNLTILASDAGHIDIRLSTEVTVIISIIDVNDNIPEFEFDHYSAVILENATGDTEVITVVANDTDSGNNSLLTYSLLYNGDNIAENSFVIDSTTGIISLSSSPLIDREAQDTFNLTISVSDNGSPALSSTATLVITIADVNDNYPVFEFPYYEGSLFENLPPNEVILKISATDADLNSNADIQYHISSLITNLTQCMSHCNVFHCSEAFSAHYNQTLTDSSIFSIDSSTGVLTSSVVFDREQIDTYVLTVTATDGGSQSLSTSVCVFITINDTNDQPPVFNNVPYIASIPENATIGTPVINVSVSDIDIVPSIITYTITKGSDHFTVNPMNGVIRTLSTFDRELQDAYNISVTANDTVNTRTTSVHVTITDINDSPPVFDLFNYTAPIQEDAPIDTSVITITASDRDIGINSQLTYNITSVLPLPHFSINLTTGTIRTTAELDRELIDTYELVITAQDSGLIPLTSTTHLTITATDINDNPPLFTNASYVTSFVENFTVSGYLLITVEATDVDIGTNSLVLYSIKSSTYQMESFSINETTGDIYFTGELDAEAITRIALTIQADNGNTDIFQYSLATVIVDIVDINDNVPTFQYSEYTVAILESSTVGSYVLQLSAIDNDITTTNNIFTYSIEDNSTFIINATTGVISTVDTLDREAISVYSLTATVTDTGTPSLNSTALVTVLILDTNDNRPVFEQSHYLFGIFENQPEGVYIGLVHAIDVDFNNITYQIDEDDVPFVIDPLNGTIFSNETFDREFVDVYNFTVQAIDNIIAGTSSEVNVTVVIFDLNDNVPNFSQDIYTSYWPEYTSFGTELLVVNATDDDAGINGVFQFYLIPSNDSTVIAINMSTGQVLLVGNLDREVQDLYTILVQVQDNGIPSLTSTAEIILHVIDVNDNIPFFNQSLYEATVTENIAIGTVLLTVSANDYDINENSQLSFDISSEFNDTFAVNSTTGTVYLISGLDYELAHNYSFFITVTDHGYPPLSSTADIFITIIDINDNSPYFEQDIYQLNVAENSILNTPVFIIPAIDIDDGLNSKLQYTILSGNIGFYFTLDEETGLLSTSDYIDREITTDFMLNVRVIDQGIPQYTATTTLNITVTDTNDNPPQFATNFPSITIPESTAIDTVVYTVKATDLDTGTNAQFSYEIINDGDAYFRVDDVSGDIIVNGSLDYETQPIHTLNLIVRDQGDLQLYDTTVLTITLTDTNEFAPVFSSPHYFFNISEQTSVGTTIAHLIATDSDATYSSTYYITANDTDVFSVVNTTGILYVLKTLSAGTFHITVTVSDGTFSTNVLVDITVHSRLYTGPLFQQSTYFFTVSENAAVGSTIGTVTLTDSTLSSSFVLQNGSLSSEIANIFSTDRER